MKVDEQSNAVVAPSEGRVGADGSPPGNPRLGNDDEDGPRGSPSESYGG